MNLYCDVLSKIQEFVHFIAQMTKLANWVQRKGNDIYWNDKLLLIQIYKFIFYSRTKSCIRDLLVIAIQRNDLLLFRITRAKYVI